MKKLTVYDAETTKLPLWREPSSHPDQPHMVQLAVKQIDTDTRKVLHAFNYIVKPQGWEFDEESTKVHGISHGLATAVGVDEEYVLRSFMKLWASNPRAGYNNNFDDRIMRIAMKRYLDPEAVDDVTEAYKQAESIDIMKMARKWKKYSKTPKLTEVYHDLFGEEMDNAHDAMGDVDATIKVYFELVDRYGIEF